MTRKTVLVFADYYLPGHLAGGPIQALANLVSHFKDEATFRVVTRNHDLGSSTVYAGVNSGAWNEIEGAEVFYVEGRPTPLLINRLISESKPSVIYLNSFFSRWYSILPLLTWRATRRREIKVLLSPRGEFASSALKIRNRRKAAYLAAFRVLGASDWVTWCASSELERNDIYHTFHSTKLKMAPNLIPKIMLTPDIASRGRATQTQRAPSDPERSKPAGELRLVFLSRISPVKNLKGALEMLRQVSIPMHFDIYGPQEDGAYWNECERIIAALPPNVTVSYRGAVSHSDVPTLLSQSDLLFLPTQGENFGYVILEALSSGCPVLLSDKTPWRDLQAKGAGWDLPLDEPARFRDAIETAWGMPAVAAAKMRASARAVAERYTSNSESVELVRRALLER